MRADDHIKSLKGLIPESWRCVDCGINTAPGLLNRLEAEIAFAVADKCRQSVSDDAEVYTVREAVWKAAGVEPMGGCLCVGCLETRLGRTLRPKDFLRDHPFNSPAFPGTPRLKRRQGKPHMMTNGGGVGGDDA